MKYIYLLVLCPLLSYGQSNQHIQGVWKHIASTWNADTKQYADCEIVKFITEDRWATIFYRAKDGEVAGYGGGTYTMNDHDYVETLEYFSWDPSAVGTQQAFTIDIMNDKMIQEGDLNTDKYKYRLYSTFEKIDDLHDYRQDNDFMTGTWKLVNATWGSKSYSPEELNARYGEIIKIVTPKHFLVAYFDKDQKTVGGAVYGTCKIRKNSYSEVLKSWSWDESAIGSNPSFSWEVTEDGYFHQYGELEDSDDYKNYGIDEFYMRIENVSTPEQLWTETDRQFLMSNLRRTTSEIVNETESLTEAQWHFKPNEDSWSIAQVVEHISLYDHFTLQNTYIAFNNKPDKEAFAQSRSDEMNIAWMGEEKPHKAYKYATPLGLMKGKDNLIYFNNIRNLLERFVSTTQRDLKAYFTPRSNEVHKKRSIHGSIVVHFGHTDRHLRQIRKIKSSFNFPG